jgi:tetratricopeptide (TPR) repeat protein
MNGAPMTVRKMFFSGIVVLALCAAACSNPEAEKQQAFESGNRYFDEKKYNDAILEYRNAIRIDPRFGEARKKLAEAYGYSGNPQAAFAEQIRAADLLPGDVEAQIKASAYLLLARQFEDAKTRAQRALALDPKNTQGLLILGNALAGLRDIDGAIAQVEQAIAIDPTNAGSYANLAGLRLAEGDRDEARVAYNKAVEVDPQSVTARIALAMFQWGTGDAAGAEASFKAALLIDPKHVLANRALASYYQGTNRGKEAEPYLRTIAEIGDDSTKLVLADYYLTENRPADAKRVLEPMVRSEGGSGSSGAELRLAQLAYREKHTAEANATLDKLLAREPRNASALMTKARWLYNDGNVQDALRRSNEAVAIDPESAEAHYLEGTMRLASRQYPEAADAFTEVLRLNPRAALAQVQLSRLTLLRGDSASALQYAQAAAKNAPGNPLARLSLARGFLAQGQTAQAETEIASLLKQYPNATGVHSLNGALKASRKDFAGARGEYERALQLDANSLEALQGLVTLDLSQGNFAGARTRVETRLTAEPDRSQLLVLAARVYAAEKNFGKAEQTLQHLIAVDSSNLNGYAMLGQVYLAQRKLEEAKSEFTKRASANPKDASSRLVVAMILEMQKRVPEARKAYDEVLAIDPRSPVAANNLAYILADANESLDRALTLAQTAVERAPNNPDIKDTLGWVYHQRQLPDLAIRAFEESIETNPENPIYHYHLGLALAKQGNLTRARRSYQTALKIRPDYTEVQQALKAIGG